MDKTEQKIVQYLSEAHATEQALVTVLQSQIAMTPGGSYRDGLESHLRETRDHVTRVQRRLDELGQSTQPATSRRWARPERRWAGTGPGEDAPRPRPRHGRRGESPKERQGRVCDRGLGDRHLHRDRASGELCGR